MVAIGVATTIHVDEEASENGEAVAHLLAHNIVPPFI